jgi:hypothetical protein
MWIDDDEVDVIGLVKLFNKYIAGLLLDGRRDVLKSSQTNGGKNIHLGL